MVTRRTTSNSLGPAGVETFTSSPTLRLRSALPIGDVVEMNPFSASASSVLTSLYSTDRKSTRLNSSHSQISYAVFCLKKNNAEQFFYSYKSNLPLARTWDQRE